MSDAALLNPQATPWEYQGKSYLLAVCDLDTELLFQALHERWARNRVEVSRGGVDPAVYAADVDAYNRMRAVNDFAFGGDLSLRFVATPQGMAEYVLLLLQKGQKEGGAEPSPKLVRALFRADVPAWLDLQRAVIGRDFPNQLVAPGSSSPAPAAPPPSTAGSTAF